MSFVDDFFILTTKIVSYATTGNPLLWRTDLGIGYLESRGYVYAEEYWQKYHTYENNGIGEKLTEFRSEFVAKHIDSFEYVCDVGIGSGQFIKHVGAKGYDINPWAQQWLKDSGYFGDPYEQKFEALTFWDVLEHIDNPELILSKSDNIFMSIPLHENVNACLKSKHLRPDEHIWHFTHDGIVFFMNHYGFELVDQSDGEIKAGREAIMTYYFRRKYK